MYYLVAFMHKLKPFHRDLIISFFLVLVTVAVFWQVNSFDFVRYDDDKYVTENRHVQAGLTKDGIAWAFISVYANNWHPLTWLSHMLDYQLFAANPAGHHLTNLFLPYYKHTSAFLYFKADDRFSLAECLCGRAVCHSSPPY